MRLSEPRVAPMAESEWSDEARDQLEKLGGASGSVFNIFKTLAHHPKLMKRWLVFGNHVLGKNTLSPREREIAILRIGWLCRAEYEWGQHAAISRGIGMERGVAPRIRFACPPELVILGLRPQD